MSATELHESSGVGTLISGTPEPLTTYEPVLAITILRTTAAGREVLVGVRTPEGNRYHKDVVSMPTRRLRDHERVGRWLASGGACDRLEMAACSASVDDEVRHLLALKLGVAEQLDLKSLSFAVLGLGAWQGESFIDVINGQDKTEQLTMLNAVIEVGEGAELFPTETQSYRPLVWVPVERFRRAATKHAVDELGFADDAGLLQWCIRGLCILTAVAMLDRLRIHT